MNVSLISTRSPEQQVPLARVSCKRCGALELNACLVDAAKFLQQVSSRGGQEMVSLE